MELRSLRLRDFRNIAAADLEFSGKHQFFVGPNGQGKTNLLEAIGFLTALRSFRTADSRLAIREGCREAAAAFRVAHEVMGETEIVLRIKPQGKEVRVDGEKVVRLADFIGRFPTVFFSSQDILVLRGSPSGRRRWLDLVLAAADPEYLAALQRYHRALAGRNSLLKQGRSGAELAAFEAQMAGPALALLEGRRTGLAGLADSVSSKYEALSAGGERVELRYRPDVEPSDPDAYSRFLAGGRERDLKMRGTHRGPHRDDFDFTIDGRAAREYASEGQQRSLVLALRIAQASYFQERLRLRPLILADDVLGELDPERRGRFWQTLDPVWQVFATGTSLATGGTAEDWQVFSVRAGTFSAGSR